MNTVILAGGKATRLNGMAKGLIQYKSKPIIEHLIDIAQLFSKKILISANTNDYDYLHLPIVKDKEKNIGPLGGILSALEYSDEKKNLIIASDLPFMSSDVIEILVEHQNEADIVLPVTNTNNIQPLCAIYSKDIIPNIYRQIQKGDFKLQNLLPLCNTKYIYLPDKYDIAFTNINTFDDLLKIDKL
ncbi:MAG: molybdenum cofactor guanylyltransferase [Bacteroidia bacterium]